MLVTADMKEWEHLIIQAKEQGVTKEQLSQWFESMKARL